MNQDLCLLFSISYFCLLITEVQYFLKNQALVNQVWATICNQFDKTLPGGLAVSGVFRWDFCNDALTCQECSIIYIIFKNMIFQA